MKKNKIKKLLRQNYEVNVVVHVPCTRIITADSEEDAREQAYNASGEEWISWVSGPEEVELSDIWPQQQND